MTRTKCHTGPSKWRTALTSHIILRERGEFLPSARHCVLCTGWFRGYLSAVSALGCEYVGDSRCFCFIVIMLNPVDISDQADGSPCCLILTAGQKPRVFQNRVLRRTFGLKRYEVTGEWRSFMICTYHQKLFGRSSKEVLDKWNMRHYGA